MGHESYDAIVIGARCAGSPTAMLLARKGFKVLLVDRATFPSDTISTHLIHPPGVAALRRWGLLDRLVASGCPPIDTYAFDFGPFALVGAPGTQDSPVSYCPRRIVLDKILVDGAAEAGAEVREAFTVEEIAIEDGRVTGIRGHGRDGAMVTETARVVIGADGRHSMVARAVQPDQYNEKPQLLAAYYGYWSNLPMNGRFETYVRPERGMAAMPTNDGLTLIIAGWPYAEFEANKKDIDGNYLKALAMAEPLADRLRAAKLETRLVGTSVPNYFRRPFGPGWALVGDAGYNKDFITAMGITDAFRDAELLVTAVVESSSGTRSFDDAMGEYRSKRDHEVAAIFELTTQLATLQPPPPELAQVLAASAGNQEAMDQFARVNAALMSPAEFFSPENIGRIMSRAGAAPS